MQLHHIIAAVVDQVVARVLRLAVLAVLIVVFALIAVYHFAAAGTIALEAKFGALNTQLIIGAGFLAAALVVLGILVAMRRGAKSKVAAPPALSEAQRTKLVMLVEAVMLGYELARKGGRRR